MNNNSAFTIIELMVALLLFSIGFLALGKLIVTEMHTNGFLKSQAEAVEKLTQIKNNLVTNCSYDNFKAADCSCLQNCSAVNSTKFKVEDPKYYIELTASNATSDEIDIDLKIRWEYGDFHEFYQKTVFIKE